MRRVGETAGVRTAAAVADSTLFAGGHVREVSGVDPAGLDAVVKLDFTSGSAKDLGPGRIAVSGTVAKEHGLSAGGHLDASMGRNQELRRYTVVGVEAAGGLGDLLTLMYGLLAIGAVISALGIVNTLAMSVAERTREIGVLRAVGTDRAGIRRMIRLEALTVAAFGTLLGLAAGVSGAWAVGSLAAGAMDRYALVVPWGTLLLVCLASLAVGAAAAIVPARRAAALGPLRAVAQA